MDERKWCWAESKDSEEWMGPFDTCEAVIAEAIDSAGDGDAAESFAISRCIYADPKDAAQRWAENLEPLEELNDHTEEELQDYNDGETYKYIGDATQSKTALIEAVVAWAERHAKTQWFCADEAAVEVIEIKKE